jgi:hypothetical protein
LARDRRIGDDQTQWLTNELAKLPKKVPIIVTLHHPPYSADTSHGGSEGILKVLDAAAKAAKRRPDLVLTGHIHLYERFTRRLKNGEEYPYVVAGGGGHSPLHSVARPDGKDPVLPSSMKLAGDDVTFESYVDDRHGMLRLEVTRDAIEGTYLTVPRPHEKWKAGATRFEAWRYDLGVRKVTRTG